MSEGRGQRVGSAPMGHSLLPAGNPGHTDRRAMAGRGSGRRGAWWQQAGFEEASAKPLSSANLDPVASVSRSHR